MEATTLDRIQFAFTLTYHYLFPQLTMGLAPLIVVFKTLAIWKKDERWNEAARFWGKILGITFLFGVVTGIPMEFQFGTNWAAFSRFAGGVIAAGLLVEAHHDPGNALSDGPQAISPEALAAFGLGNGGSHVGLDGKR